MTFAPVTSTPDRMACSQFDSEYDAALGELNLDEPSWKRQRVGELAQYEFPSDELDEILCIAADHLENVPVACFFDDNDEFLCQAAEVMELLPEPFQFKTGIGRPHPLFLPEVVGKVMSYLSDAQTVRNCREVCTFWYESATERWMKVTKVKSLAHVFQRNPFKQKSFNHTPGSPTITNLNVSDACAMYKSPSMNNLGGNLRHVTFNGNFWCMGQVNFLHNLVFNWCVNLEELQVSGITNRLVMSYSSGCTIPQEIRPVKLKSMKIIAQRKYRAHANIHTLRDFSTFGGNVRDGGVLGKIINQAENLDNLELACDWIAPTQILVNGTCDQMRELTVTGGRITSSDLDRIQGVWLRSLKIGPLKFLTKSFKRLLNHLSSSLEHLELFPDQKTGHEYSVRFPPLPNLTRLVVHDIMSIQLGTIAFVNNIRNLQHLHLNVGKIKNRIVSIASLFAGVPNVHALSSIELSGDCDFAHVRLWEWFPNLKSVKTVLHGVNHLADAMSGFTKLLLLESLHIEHTRLDIQAMVEIFKTSIPEMKRLNNLALSFARSRGCKPAFTILHFNSFIRGSTLKTLRLANYAILDHEARTVASLLSETLNSVTLQDCSIQCSGVNRSVRLNNVYLCKCNVNVLINQYFRPVCIR